MIYNRLKFGMELKERVSREQDVGEIGRWAYEIYLMHISDINDEDLDRILLTLNGMTDGPEFAFSYERLNEIADYLISGHDVSLHY